MVTFTEFYTTAVGFVLFKLYKDANLHYPPKLEMKAINKPSVTDADKDEEDDDLVMCDNDEIADEVLIIDFVPIVFSTHKTI